MNFNGEPTLATKREAANILRVSPRTIDRWVAAGRLTPRYTPSGRPRFLLSDLDGLLSSPVHDAPAGIVGGGVSSGGAA